MIANINELKSKINSPKVNTLCDTALASLSSVIYNAVTPEAKFEIERVAVETLFEGLSKETTPTVKEWLNNQQRIYSVKNLGVRNAVNALKLTEARTNQTLEAILEDFERKLQDAPEVLLYEKFVGALNSMRWIPGVNKQIGLVLEKVEKYKNDVEITKVIEEMKNTRSNYLLPLIEDVVDNYLKEKNEQNKHVLKETLVKFSYDPFVRNIINIVMRDATQLQLEYNNASVDIQKVYSPIVYLGENEVMFNVKGTYYVKKGNNVSRIKNAEVVNIDPQFRVLCETINLPNVEVDRKSIRIYTKNDTAEVFETHVVINEKQISKQQFKESAEYAEWTDNVELFRLTEALSQNFSEIVEIDFVKRVSLVENEGHAADIFKLRDNIFITTYNPDNNKVTFYRNVNPIQAEKIMMEHMRFDVSKTFEDILPNKEKILSTINEDKQAYMDYINELEQKIEEFQNSPFNQEVTESVIEALLEELEEVKNEYKDYVNEVEKHTSVSEEVTVTIDVDGERYTVPIPQRGGAVRGETVNRDLGTVVGAENIEDSPASQVTYGDDNALLGDQTIDLGVDNVEAEADAAEAGAEEEPEEETSDLEGGDETEGDDLLGGDEEGEEDILGGEEEEEEEEEEEAEESDGKKYDPEEDMITDDIEPEVDQAEEVEDEEFETQAEEEPKPAKLDKETFDEESDEEGEEEVEVLDGEVEVKDKSKPRVFLVKKAPMKESFKINLKKNKVQSLNEGIQILDTVTLDGKKGYVIGQTGDGDVIVQIQGSTFKTPPSKVKLFGKKQEENVKPPIKFDKITQKVLFEQYVRCGIFMGNTPVKTSGCAVKYSDWKSAADNDDVKIIIEGNGSFLQKNQIRIFEDVNAFANDANYDQGVLIDEVTQEAIENVFYNVEDFTAATGGADEVRIIKMVDGQQIPEVVPASSIKTLAV